MSLRLEMGDPLLGPAGQVALEMLVELPPNGYVTREYPNMRIRLAAEGTLRAVTLVDDCRPIHEYGLEVWACAFGQPDAVWRQDWRIGGRVASMRWHVALLPDPLTIDGECQYR